jgi:hypothetical protein
MSSAAARVESLWTHRENDSGAKREKLFAFSPEWSFTCPEPCSPFTPGIAFTFLLSKQHRGASPELII